MYKNVIPVVAHMTCNIQLTNGIAGTEIYGHEPIKLLHFVLGGDLGVGCNLEATTSCGIGNLNDCVALGEGR